MGQQIFHLEEQSSSPTDISHICSRSRWLESAAFSQTPPRWHETFCFCRAKKTFSVFDRWHLKDAVVQKILLSSHAGKYCYVKVLRPVNFFTATSLSRPPEFVQRKNFFFYVTFYLRGLNFSLYEVWISDL